MVPKELTEEQKQRRVTIFQDLLEKQDDILGRVITGDETWVYQYDPEMKRQSAQWKTANSPWSKKFRQSKSRVKTMFLTFFFSIRGINHYEFVPKGQTVNQVYYLEVLEELREKVRNDPIFLPTTHGSCITTTHLLTRHCLWGNFLSTKQITVLEHPAYSSDLAPQWLFSGPEGKGNIERKAFSLRWWHQE